MTIDRIWQLHDVDPDTLARQLASRIWPLCQGFRLLAQCGNYLVLNISLTTDPDPDEPDFNTEYAILFGTDGERFTQVDSFNISVATEDRLRRTFQAMVEGRFEHLELPRWRPIRPTVELPDGHRSCRWCGPRSLPTVASPSTTAARL